MALKPGQYQIGDYVFGKDTDTIVTGLDIQTYNVNNQDFQVDRTDERRFGIDTHVPGSLMFDMAVLNNYELDNMAALGGGQTPIGIMDQSRTLLGKLLTEWKSDDIRRSWGAMKPLYFCDSDGVTRRVYGRPGKFSHGPIKSNSEWITAKAEFRRADTRAYDDTETFIELYEGANPVYIFRDAGDSDAWLRVLLYGPVEHPIITLGDYQIELDMSVAADTVLEVSSYPWMRRIVDSDGNNWRTKMIGETVYLDQLKLPPNTYIPMRWTNNAVTTWTEIPHLRWDENVDFWDIFSLWDEYTQISGRAMWGWNISCGGYLFAPFGRAACLDNRHYFGTSSQFAQVRLATVGFLGDLVEQGTAGLVIMSNNSMSNLVCLEIEQRGGTGNDWLRIRSGSYDNLITRQEYHVTNGFKQFDTVGIWVNPTTHTFTMQHNGVDVGQPWIDSTHIVNTANRRQGFILNIANSLSSHGPGIDNLVAYDIAIESPPVGRCIVLWRDAYNVL